jgi:hypothetical protein
VIKLEIPRIPPSPNDLLGMHWRYRKKNCDLWQKEVWYALITAGYSPQRIPYPRAKVCIHRQSHGELDPDNLVACVKPILDALRYAHVLVDDSSKHLELVVTQARTPRASAPCTLIEIRPLEAA